MKTKKPRSGKAVKSAVQKVRHVTRRKPKLLRRKAGSARAKRVKTKGAKKSTTRTRRKTGAAVKAKRVSRRVIRIPRARRSPSPVASEPLELTLGAVPEPESEAAPSGPAKPPCQPGGEEPEEKELQAEFGFRIPEILLEGDEPAAPPATGPGRKYALGPATLTGLSGQEELALPEAYGTGKLLLAARDPHWLYAHWDLTPQEQRRYNALSADGHLLVRVYPEAVAGQPLAEVQVHPESRHWFVHVARAETRYVAELGYYGPEHQWVTVATSTPTQTPPDRVSADQTIRFATIPHHARLTQLAAPAKQTAPADLPPFEAARERALAELVALQAEGRDAMSSMEIGGIGSLESLGGKAGDVSSPAGAAEQPRAGFWFNVNADLVIYGATEPDASVTLGGQPLQLRPDGTFSCRFSLPDGEHSVTVSALSTQGDLRQAELNFSRSTDYRGEVGTVPPDPSLQPPAAKQP